MHNEIIVRLFVYSLARSLAANAQAQCAFSLLFLLSSTVHVYSPSCVRETRVVAVGVAVAAIDIVILLRILRAILVISSS